MLLSGDSYLGTLGLDTSAKLGEKVGKYLKRTANDEFTCHGQLCMRTKTVDKLVRNLVLSNFDSRALLPMTARERRVLWNPETGVFLIGFHEEQGTST